MQKTTYSVNNQPVTVYLRDEADQSVAAEIFKLREYRIAEETIQQATGAIIDGGAHSGMFSLYARQYNATAPIIAIEPEEKNLELLKRHIVENKVTGIQIVEGALARDYGRKKLLLSKDSHNHRLLVLDEHTEEKNETVLCYNLGKIIALCPNETVSLLKLDIEGGEYEVFAGATTSDFSRIKTVLMEYHTIKGHTYKEVEQALREHGFGVRVFPSKFDKTMGFLWAVNKRT